LVGSVVLTVQWVRSSYVKRRSSFFLYSQSIRGLLSTTD